MPTTRGNLDAAIFPLNCYKKKIYIYIYTYIYIVICVLLYRYTRNHWRQIYDKLSAS